MDEGDFPNQYDTLAERYCARVDEKPYNADYERPFMCGLLPPLKGLSVLDLGSGSGYYSALAHAQGAKNITAVDASQAMVARTLARVDGPIDGVVANLADPMDYLSDQSVDVIIASLVFHYLPEWLPTLLECKRVLKPGGRLLISVQHPLVDHRLFPDGNYHETLLVEDDWGGFGDEPFPVKFYRRPLSAMLSPLLKCGLQWVDCHEPQPSPRLAAKNPRIYQYLKEKPGFLFFELYQLGGVGQSFLA